MLLYQDETVLWRFALPRCGWWRRSQRYRLPTHPLSQGQINVQERLKRQTWQRYRSWSRITSGVLLHVMGAVQYGTSRVFYKLVPHFNPTTSLDRNEAENTATWLIFAYDDSSNKQDKMALRHLKSLYACQVTL